MNYAHGGFVCALTTCIFRLIRMFLLEINSYLFFTLSLKGHFTVVYLFAGPLIWSEAEVDHVVIKSKI